MKPLVTVIIPIPNVSDHFNDCISSIINQVYSKLEILLIQNDESSKNNLKFSEEWAQNDQRIKIIDGNNYNSSECICGEYVVYVDPDDWIKNNMIQSMLEIFNQRPIDMIECQFVKQNGRLAYEASAELRLFNRKEYIKLLVKNNDYAGGYLWRKMFKRSILPNNFSLSDIRVKNRELFSNILTEVNHIACLNIPFYFHNQMDTSCLVTYKVPMIFDDYQSYYDNLAKLEPDLKLSIESEKIRYYMITLKYLNNDASTKNKQVENKIIDYVSRYPLDLHNFDYKVLKNLLSIFRNKQLAIVLWLKMANFHQLILDNKFRRYLHKILKYKRLCLTDKRLFIVFGKPDAGNLGDRALEIAEEQFIMQYFSDYKQEDVMLYDTNVLKILHFFIKKNSIISDQAGGNLGTLYPFLNEINTKILVSLRKRPVIIFPQTYYFSADKYGEDTKEMMAAVYRKMKNFYIFTRDPMSYKLVSSQLYSYVSLVPDLVLFLKPVIKHYHRENALVILRDDTEKTLTNSERQYVLDEVRQQNLGKLLYADTHVHYDGISIRFAKNRIDELWDKYFHAKVVITDRLHGMIFAAITNTPCVTILSQSPKIKGVYNQWLKENDYIELVENLDDLPKAICKVTSVKNPQLKRDKLDAGFDKMAQKIRERVKEK